MQLDAKYSEEGGILNIHTVKGQWLNYRGYGAFLRLRW